MSYKIRQITGIIEEFAPLSYQESYDNAGLQVGNPDAGVESALVCIDVTEAIVDEAIALGAGLIVAHHPLIFGGLKRLTGASYVERTVMKAISHNIAIYAAHTNLDAMAHGVNRVICDKIGLTNTRILSPARNELVKLVTYVPVAHTDKVRDAIFEAGAGCIGNYDCCSYNIEGYGTFRANGDAHPFVGQKGGLHREAESRLETVLPSAMQGRVLKAMLEAHPYEEVAYDIFKLENSYLEVGSGMIGQLATPVDELTFLQHVKEQFGCKVIKHTALLNRTVQKVAVCGGSGSFLMRTAMSHKADVFVTADVKYHDFFNTENQIVVADIGHYESEKFTKELIRDIIRKKMITFAVHLTGINTNPINYL